MTSAQAPRRSTAALGAPRPHVPPRWLTGTSRRILLPPLPASTRPARDFTAAVLRGWRLRVLTQDAVLIASELTANAVRYGVADAAEPVELAWWKEPDEILCVVTDTSADPPVLAPPDLGAESGRGLQIVDALTAGWGWTVLGLHRKAVWAALRLPPPR